jgi:hypothetical protein
VTGINSEALQAQALLMPKEVVVLVRKQGFPNTEARCTRTPSYTGEREVLTSHQPQPPVDTFSRITG